MDIFVIVILVLLTIFLVVVEALLIPGVTIAAIAAGISGLYAVYLIYQDYGLVVSVVAFMVILALSMATLFLCVKRKNISRMELKTNSDSSIPSVRDKVSIGSQGVALSRLAPIGTVLIGSESVEAKSLEGFIDQKSVVEVVGFDDNVALVKRA